MLSGPFLLEKVFQQENKTTTQCSMCSERAAEDRILQEEAGKSLAHRCFGVFMDTGPGGGCKGGKKADTQLWQLMKHRITSETDTSHHVDVAKESLFIPAEYVNDKPNSR